MPLIRDQLPFIQQGFDQLNNGLALLQNLIEYETPEATINQLHAPVLFNLKSAITHLGLVLSLPNEAKKAGKAPKTQNVELEDVANLIPKRHDDYLSLIILQKITKALQRLNQLGYSFVKKLNLKADFSIDIQNFIEEELKPALIKIVQYLYLGLSDFLKEPALAYVLINDANKLKQLNQVTQISSSDLPDWRRDSKDITDFLFRLSKLSVQSTKPDQLKLLEACLDGYLPVTGNYLYGAKWRDDYGY